MRLRSAALATVFTPTASTAAGGQAPLRLENLKRCGDLLERRQDWCLTVRGLGERRSVVTGMRDDHHVT
jgi:hypothetical protein